MLPLGILTTLFGIIILLLPNILEYLIAFVLIVSGITTILTWFMTKPKRDGKMKFGNYEIHFQNKKK